MKIYDRWTQALLFESPHKTMRETVEAAVKTRADLTRANLTDADLTRANLTRANLTRADLTDANLTDADLTDADLTDANLTGCPWSEYLAEVVPALLTVAGKSLQQILDAGAWECHSWDNCPIAVAFGVPGLPKVPALYRQRAAEFVRLFDARLIPRSVIEDAIRRDDEAGGGSNA